MTISAQSGERLMPTKARINHRVVIVYFMEVLELCFVFIFFAGLLSLRTSPTVVARYQQRLDTLMAEDDLPVMSHKHATNRRYMGLEPEPRRKTIGPAAFSLAQPAIPQVRRESRKSRL